MATKSTIDTVTLVGGIDVGNGYTKGAILGIETGDKDLVDMPSSVKVDVLPVPEIPFQAADLPSVVNTDFFNALDASIESRQVKQTSRLKYGKTSLQTNGTQFLQFDISDDNGKADQELYPMLVLGTLAAKALKDWYSLNKSHAANKHGEGVVFPTTEIVAEVYVGLALPIREFEKHHRSFSRKFTGEGTVPASHTVTIKNFEEPITVRLVFKFVAVDPEGGAAQYAIGDLGNNIIEQMIADNKALGIEVAEGVTPEVIQSSLNTIGIDIGEGTVNFPVFTETLDGEGSAFNSGASGMLDQGYGTVMENALRLLASGKFKFSDRKRLANFIQRYENNPQPQHREQYEAVVVALQKVTEPFVTQLVDQYKRVASAAGIHDVVYVYGGGSGPRWIHTELRDQLDQAETKVPVFYLDSQYSRNLNRHGLFLSGQSGVGKV